MSDFLAEQKPSRRLWIFAALAALAIHIGGAALAIAHLRTDDSDEGLGASGIEIGLEMASPHIEESDLPPGPDTDASVASPALAEQKAVVKETDLPKDTPTETENPDRVVTENDSKKPKEEEPEKAAVQTSASTESVAAEATAQQSLDDAREDKKSTAVHEGIGKEARRLAAEWGRQLSAYFERHKRYPKVQTAKNAKVRVNFEIDRVGHVLSVAVVQSSGDPLFDEAAISMIRRSDPVPRPPPEQADLSLKYDLDVIFNERSERKK